MSKVFDECVQILDKMATNDYNYLKDSLIIRKPTNMSDCDQIFALTNQVVALEEKEVEQVRRVVVDPRGCEAYGIEHGYGDCMSITKIIAKTPNQDNNHGI